MSMSDQMVNRDGLDRLNPAKKIINWESVARKLHESCLNAKGAYGVIKFDDDLVNALPGFKRCVENLDEAIEEFEKLDRLIRYQEFADLEDPTELWDTGETSDNDKKVRSLGDYLRIALAGKE